MRKKYPNYMIPYSIVFIDKIPVTSRGKLDKRSLPEPDIAYPALISIPANEPSTQIEKDIASYWQEIL